MTRRAALACCMLALTACSERVATPGRVEEQSAPASQSAPSLRSGIREPDCPSNGATPAGQSVPTTLCLRVGDQQNVALEPFLFRWSEPVSDNPGVCAVARVRRDRAGAVSFDVRALRPGTATITAQTAVPPGSRAPTRTLRLRVTVR